MFVAQRRSDGEACNRPTVSCLGAASQIAERRPYIGSLPGRHFVLPLRRRFLQSAGILTEFPTTGRGCAFGKRSCQRVPNCWSICIARSHFQVRRRIAICRHYHFDSYHLSTKLHDHQRNENQRNVALPQGAGGTRPSRVGRDALA